MMGHLRDVVRALATTLANAFRRPVTVQFPAEVRQRPERFRVSFAMIDDEHGEMACIGCLACERICPSQVIKMKPAPKRESPVTGKKRAYVDAFVLDLSACIQCELCVQVCNSDAIVMVRQAETPAFAREDLVLDLSRLRANAKERPLSWARGTLLQAMQEVPKAKPASTVKPTSDAEARPVSGGVATMPATSNPSAPPPQTAQKEIA